MVVTNDRRRQLELTRDVMLPPLIVSNEENKQHLEAIVFL